MLLKTKKQKRKDFIKWSYNMAFKKGYDHKKALNIFDMGAYQRHNKTNRYTIVKEYYTNKHYKLITNNGFNVLFDNTTIEDNYLTSKIV